MFLLAQGYLPLSKTLNYNNLQKRKNKHIKTIDLINIYHNQNNLFKFNNSYNSTFAYIRYEDIDQYTNKTIKYCEV